MAGASRPATADAVELMVHNEESSTVDVRTVVHADSVSVYPLTLSSDETGSITAPAGVPVEVHAPGGTATALAHHGALFVVRDGRVLVASV